MTSKKVPFAEEQNEQNFNELTGKKHALDLDTQFPRKQIENPERSKTKPKKPRKRNEFGFNISSNHSIMSSAEKDRTTFCLPLGCPLGS
uniref:Uncharacterized protein n=1 Tax=Globodera rostochiensis TaxID=31243 RepID=A0A914IHB5_GLORO